LIFRIDDLNDYSKNFFDIFNYQNTKDTIIKYASSLLVRPFTNACGKSHKHIDSYNYFVIDENYNLKLVDELFIPNNKQIIILLNKNIEFFANNKIISEKILKYVKLRVPDFYRIINEGLYNNLKYDYFVYDQFSFLY